MEVKDYALQDEQRLEEINRNACSLATMSELELFTFWERNYHSKPLYHGTNTQAFKSIRKSGGLDPHLRYWDDDLFNLHKLYKHKGRNRDSTNISTHKPGMIFLSAGIEAGISYAKRSPEYWTFLFGGEEWRKFDLESEVQRVTEKFVGLTLQEAEHIQIVVRKYWEFFQEAKPLILVFNSNAVLGEPNQGWLTDFKYFKKNFQGVIQLSPSYLTLPLTDVHISLGKTISLDYLIDAKEVH